MAIMYLAYLELYRGYYSVINKALLAVEFEDNGTVKYKVLLRNELGCVNNFILLLNSIFLGKDKS